MGERLLPTIGLATLLLLPSRYELLEIHDRLKAKAREGCRYIETVLDEA